MSLEQEVELIRQFPIFRKIQPAMQKLLCFGSERLTFAAGDGWRVRGDPTEGALVVAARKAGLENLHGIMPKEGDNGVRAAEGEESAFEAGPG